MQKPKIPINEKQRQKALESYNILDSLPEQSFDDLTLIASQICQAPIALVSLVDNDRQWFKSKYGLDANETHRDISFCGHAINEPNQIFEISNAKEDERFFDNPLVTGDLNIGFYAGVPLVDSKDMALGTLCVIDKQPKILTSDQKEALKALAREVMSRIKLRKKNQVLKKKIGERTEELNESKVKYYKLYHDAPDMMVSVDPKTRKVIECNQTLCKRIGYKQEQIIGKDIFELYHPDCHDEVAIAFKEFIEKGVVSNKRLILRTRNNGKTHVALSVNAIKDKAGNITHSNSIWRDIGDLISVEEELKQLNQKLETKVKKRTEELRFHKERMELALIGTNDGIWDWTDVNSDKEWWSPRFHDLLGYKEGEITQDLKTFSEVLLHPEDAQHTFAAVEDCFQKGIPMDVEYRLKTKKGDYKWFRGRGNISRDKDGNPIRMTGSISDISRQKALELELHTHAEKLATQNEDLKQFAYVATHDLKSPMVSIEGHFNFLKTQFENQNKKVFESIAFIEEEIEQFNSNLHGLTEALRLKEGSIEKETIDLNKTINKVLPPLKNKIEQLNGKLHLNLNEESNIVGSQVYISSILHNLISNAIKYRSEERRLNVKISTKIKDKHLFMEIEDNGLGINLSLHKNKIFKMFNRFHDKAEGSGMGLYMVKNMIEKLGGNIEVQSKVNKGTKFNLQFERS